MTDWPLRLRESLRAWLSGFRRLAVLGIGNPLRTDDAVGLTVIENLEGRVPENVMLIKCETAPENFLSRIEQFKPTHVLMIDAAQLNGESGTSRLIPAEEIGGLVLSTHTLPLSIMAGLIKQTVGAEVMVLGIQPETLDFGEGLSHRLQEASAEIADIIISTLREARRRG